jgi:hypothetical protein
LLLVNGFLGKSSEEDHAKIYWDVSLNSFVDVKDSDIVQTESLSKEASPLGGSYVWVKRDAKVYFGAGGTVHQGQVLGRPYDERIRRAVHWRERSCDGNTGSHQCWLRAYAILPPDSVLRDTNDRLH